MSYEAERVSRETDHRQGAAECREQHEREEPGQERLRHESLAWDVRTGERNPFPVLQEHLDEQPSTCERGDEDERSAPAKHEPLKREHQQLPARSHRGAGRVRAAARADRARAWSCLGHAEHPVGARFDRHGERHSDREVTANISAKGAQMTEGTSRRLAVPLCHQPATSAEMRLFTTSPAAIDDRATTMP